MTSPPIIIIGNGIAGISAAREIRKRSSQRIVVISEESPFMISRPALMYVYMGHMKAEHIEPYERSFWRKNNIELIHAEVKAILTDQDSIQLADEKIIAYDQLILATGSQPRSLGISDENSTGIVSLYHWQDLQKIEEMSHPFGTSLDKRKIRSAVVVGGGLIGVELAEMLHTRDINVTMVIRDSHFWGSVVDAHEGALIQQQLDRHHIRTIYSSSVAHIVASGGQLQAIQLTSGEQVECQMLGITIGVQPRTDLAQRAGMHCDRGILVDEHLRTSVANIYAIGDCAEVQNPLPTRKSIESVWYTGKMMGETVARTITEKNTVYQPGIWFNSAKFFQLEYQTYGQVNVKPSSDQDHLHWTDDNKNRGIKCAFHPQTFAFLGLNTWGIRMRQDRVFAAIEAKTSIVDVINLLPSFDFDAEFTGTDYSAIQHHLSQALNHPIPV
jgi:3-phenylpropionate/trans-cinnamate dioxygenase ferredoxin reductase component